MSETIVNSITVRVELPDGKPPIERIYIDDSKEALDAVMELMGGKSFVLDFLRAFDATTDGDGSGEFQFEWEFPPPNPPGCKLTIIRGQIKEGK